MIRLATITDLDRVDALAVRVIEHMATANIPQWTLAYPRKQHYRNDVRKKALFVYEQDGRIVGAFTILPEQDPPYETITGWLTNHGESLVIHRAIVDPNRERSGVASTLMNHAFALARQGGFKSIKIDTHHDNYKMRNFLRKHGFRHIGYLAVIDREAYERLLED